MADYHPLIARAVAGLEKNTGDARRVLYERARTALVTQLRGVNPALNESDMTRERLALEEAIRKVEADAARKRRCLRAIRPPRCARPTHRAGRRREAGMHPLPLGSRRWSWTPAISDASALRRAALRQSRRPAPRPTTRCPPPRGALRRVPRPPLAARMPRAAKPIFAARVRGRMNSVRPPPVRHNPRATPLPRCRSGLRLSALAGHADAGAPPLQDFSRTDARAVRSRSTTRGRCPPRCGRRRALRMMPTSACRGARTAISSRSPSLLSSSAASPVSRFGSGQRGCVPSDLRTPATKWRVEAPSAPQRTTRPRSRRVRQDQRARRRPAPRQAQRWPSVLCFTKKTRPIRRASVMSARRSGAPRPYHPGPDQPPELAIRADVEIPDRKIAMTWSLRRNTDASLPASHTIEIMFKLPTDFAPEALSPMCPAS